MFIAIYLLHIFQKVQKSTARVILSLFRTQHITLFPQVKKSQFLCITILWQISSSYQKEQPFLTMSNIYSKVFHTPQGLLISVFMSLFLIIVFSFSWTLSLEVVFLFHRTFYIFYYIGTNLFTISTWDVNARHKSSEMPGLSILF